MLENENRHIDNAKDLIVFFIILIFGLFEQINILSSINQIILGSNFIIEITTYYCTYSWYCQFLQSKNLAPYPL